MGRKRTVRAVLVTLILTLLLVGGAAFVLSKGIIDKKDIRISELEGKISPVSAYAFTKDMKAGSIITPNDVTPVSITQETKSAGIYLVNAAGESWTDAQGEVHQYVDYLDSNEGTIKKVLIDEDIYGRRVKANITQNSLVLESMLYAKEGPDNKDVRMEELSDSFLQIPTDLTDSDYIDVRIQFPTGEDYSVIVGKRVEALGTDSNGDPTPSSIYVKMSEDDIMLVGSALIESFINDGTRLYANKYVDPSTQLFKEEILDYVAKYEYGVNRAIEAKKSAETTTPASKTPQYGPSGELIETSTTSIDDPYAVTTYTEKDVTDEEINIYANIGEGFVKQIREAREANDKDTLNFFRRFKVQTKTALKATYAVKDEVYEVVLRNPNILESIKAEFKARQDSKTRIDKYVELKNKLASMPESSYDPYGGGNTKRDEIETEMESLLNTRAQSVDEAITKEKDAQKNRRAAYIASLFGTTVSE